jgi:hypothetical protein
MLKLEDELKIARIIATYKSLGAFRCEALFKEVNEELEIIGI